jgi:hypothetical protein
MKFLVLSENGNGTWPYLYYRGMGALELHKRIQQHGYQSTLIDWFTVWSPDKLTAAIQAWFGDEVNPVIAISTPFDITDVYKIKEVLAQARTRYPNLKVIHGGSRTYNPQIKDIDVFFLGRSMQVFDAWLKGTDLTVYTVNTDPLVLVNKNFDQTVDTPVLPKLDDNDFLTPYDILGFEIGVGCKFNCTFCNYELRGAKVTTLTDSYTLKQYFEEAHAKYGIRYFFAADDTPNETDDKLAILADAVDGLSFKPKITAYSRLDIITGRPQQLELYRRIQFDSLFFGIESFNNNASRLVRKKSDIGSVEQTLKDLRRLCPDTFTVGGIIIGLNGDSESSIRSSLDRVVEQQLLDSVQLYPLSISRSRYITDPGYHSALDNDPAGNGYPITGLLEFHRGNSAVQNLNWTSDWSNSIDAGELSQQLYLDYRDKINTINFMEYTGLNALGLAKRDLYLTPTQVWQSQAMAKSSRLKLNYIDKKLNWLLTNSNQSCIVV